MKRIKKWSFLIILVITGIIYYKADESLLQENWQKNMETLGRERPEGGWQQLFWGNASGSEEEESSTLEPGNAGPEEEIPENRGSEESAGQAGDPGTAEPGQPTGPEGDPGTAEPGQSAGPEGDPGVTEPGQSTGPEGDPGQTGMPGSQAAQVAGPPEVPPELGPKPEIRIGRVEDDYFSDALFLGDSRTVGMQEYGGLGDIATFYASTGMTIYKLFDAEIVEVPDQKDKITVEEALQLQSFGKIYIMMGINEMGWGTVESFAQSYGEVVARLRELQPDAIIYIQGILKVTTARSEKGDYINNEGIDARNEALSQLADGEKIFYLDVNSAVCDEDGGLVKDYTFDGVHLKAKYISLWKEFLKDNAVLLD